MISIIKLATQIRKKMLRGSLASVIARCGRVRPDATPLEEEEKERVA